MQAINLVQKALPTIQRALPKAQKGIRAGGGSNINKSFDPKGLYSPKIADNIHKYTYSGTAYKGPNNYPDIRRYQDSYLLIKEIVSGAPNRLPYNGNSRLLTWSLEGVMNGSQGYYQLTIDPVAQHITHFNYVGGF